jgi:hypothetical protein
MYDTMEQRALSVSGKRTYLGAIVKPNVGLDYASMSFAGRFIRLGSLDQGRRNSCITGELLVHEVQE